VVEDGEVIGRSEAMKPIDKFFSELKFPDEIVYIPFRGPPEKWSLVTGQRWIIGPTKKQSKSRSRAMKTDLSKKDMMEAISEGVARGIMMVACNDTIAPCADFFHSIKTGVKEAIMTLGVDCPQAKKGEN
jgi:hypothetical protein